MALAGALKSHSRRTGAWSEATYRDRRADIEAVLDERVERRNHFKVFRSMPVESESQDIPWEVTPRLAIAGAWPSWKDPRIRAVLALSPFNSPFVANGELGHLNVPGALSRRHARLSAFRPLSGGSSGAYDRSSAPKYYVEFRGAGHLAWTDLNPRFHGIINRYSVAFFNRYLKEGSGGEGLAALFESERPTRASACCVPTSGSVTADAGTTIRSSTIARNARCPRCFRCTRIRAGARPAAATGTWAAGSRSW